VTDDPTGAHVDPAESAGAPERNAESVQSGHSAAPDDPSADPAEGQAPAADGHAPAAEGQAPAAGGHAPAAEGRPKPPEYGGNKHAKRKGYAAAKRSTPPGKRGKQQVRPSRADAEREPRPVPGRSNPDAAPPPAQANSVPTPEASANPDPEPREGPAKLDAPGQPEEANPSQPSPDQPSPDQPSPDQPSPGQPSPDQPGPEPAAGGRPREGLRVGPWLELSPTGPEPGFLATQEQALGVPTDEPDLDGGPTDPTWLAPTAQLPLLADDAAPAAATDRVRRWTRDYAWLLATAGVAAAVLLVSLPLLSKTGPTWNRGDPVAAASASPSPLPAAPAVADAPSPVPASASPSPTRRSPGPAQTKARANLRTSPSRTVEAAAPPVALGPADGYGLRDMLRGYCRAKYPDANVDASLRSGLDPATNNWECQISGVRDDPLIDMNAACRWRYPPSSFARFADAHNAFSWRCYRNA
jgi:hypothetical protein